VINKYRETIYSEIWHGGGGGGGGSSSSSSSSTCWKSILHVVEEIYTCQTAFYIFKISRKKERVEKPHGVTQRDVMVYSMREKQIANNVKPQWFQLYQIESLVKYEHVIWLITIIKINQTYFTL
jgi:hypothetical protein